MDIHANSSRQSEINFVEVALPAQTNHYGNFYAANALELMGKAAFVCATRHAGCAVSMAKADGIEFVRPVRQGSIVNVRARVVFQGHSSMTVIVEITPDNSAQRETPSVNGRFMMVAVDSDGIPIAIPASNSYPAEEIRP